MRIGIYTSSIAVRRGYENIVSAHVQIPLHTARLLLDAGHEVHLITTEYQDDLVLPAITPESIPVHQLRQFHLELTEGGSRSGQGSLRRATTALYASSGLVRLARVWQFDVIHFFGANGTAELAGLARWRGIPCPVCVTLNTGRNPGPASWFRRWIWKRIDRMLTTTDFFQQALSAKGVKSHKVSQGIVRRLRGGREADSRRKNVLFWREASPLNGGDLGADVFRQLAPRYPEINFVFAVRPHKHQPGAVAELANEMPNVNLYTTPYPEGITLESLMSEAICVVQLFRTFTIQPQFSILESMCAGVPVVATSIESADEIIESGINGLLVPPEDARAAADAVEFLIKNPEKALSMGDSAARSIAGSWNWDSYTKEIVGHYRSVSERSEALI